MDGSKVSGAFLELANACSYEFFHREWFDKVRDKKGSLCDVKWKGGFHAMCHVKRGEAGRLANSGTVSPEGERGDRQPLRAVTITCLEDGVVYHAVLLLNNAVRLRVICQDVDVVNAIPLRKPVKCCDVSHAIVSDDLSNCSPSAEDLLEDKCGNHVSILQAKGMPLGPGCE